VIVLGNSGFVPDLVIHVAQGNGDRTTGSDATVRAAEHRLWCRAPLARHGNSWLSLGSYPDFHWSDELARCWFTDMDTVSRNLFTRFEMERNPRLGHALKLHFLNGQARRRIHDGCYDTHGLRRYRHSRSRVYTQAEISPNFSEPRTSIDKNQSGDQTPARGVA